MKQLMKLFFYNFDGFMAGPEIEEIKYNLEVNPLFANKILFVEDCTPEYKMKQLRMTSIFCRFLREIFD